MTLIFSMYFYFDLSLYIYRLSHWSSQQLLHQMILMEELITNLNMIALIFSYLRYGTYECISTHYLHNIFFLHEDKDGMEKRHCI